MIRNFKVSVNDVQGYLARGAEIHPLLYRSFLHELRQLEITQKLCVTPQTRLEMYSFRVSQNIARRLAA